MELLFRYRATSPKGWQQRRGGLQAPDDFEFVFGGDDDLFAEGGDVGVDAGAVTADEP